MTTPPTPGIDILNCGAGHMEVRFDHGDPIEMERARRVITDMLKRGYVLFVEGADKALIRVKSFDAARGVYIIADGPLYPGTLADEPEPAPEEVSIAPEPGAEPPPKRRGRPPKDRAVPMESVRTTAIARSAGG